MKTTVIKFLSQTVIVSMLLMLCGCAGLRGGAPYDEQTDMAVTQIRFSMEQFLNVLERDIGSGDTTYASHAKFYEKIKADISAARARVKAMPGNEDIYSQFGFMELIVLNLERTHQYGIIREDIPPIRNAFNAYSASVLRMVIARK